MNTNIKMEVEGGVASLIMTRPEIRNALTDELRDALAECMQQCEMDAAIRCVVLRGSSGQFMGGGNLSLFATSKHCTTLLTESPRCLSR